MIIYIYIMWLLRWLNRRLCRLQSDNINCWSGARVEKGLAVAFFVQITLKYVKLFYIDIGCFIRCKGDRNVSLTSLQEEFFPHFFVEMWVFNFHALLEFSTVYMWALWSNYKDVINLYIDLWLKSTTTRCLGMPTSKVLLHVVVDCSGEQAENCSLKALLLKVKS